MEYRHKDWENVKPGVFRKGSVGFGGKSAESKTKTISPRMNTNKRESLKRQKPFNHGKHGPHGKENREKENWSGHQKVYSGLKFKWVQQTGLHRQVREPGRAGTPSRCQPGKGDAGAWSASRTFGVIGWKWLPLRRPTVAIPTVAIPTVAIPNHIRKRLHFVGLQI